MSRSRTPTTASIVGDAVAIGLVVAFAFLPFPDAVFRPHGWLLAVALLPALVVPLRRRAPVAALVVALGATAVGALSGVVLGGAIVVVAVAAFATADRTRRPLGVACVVVAALGVFALNAVALRGELFDSRAGQFVLIVVAAGALGDATRSRREHVAAVIAHTERTAADRARVHLLDQRVRIARDLHDIVAHRIAVIGLSAGAASSAIPARPDRAQEALAMIRATSRSVLGDIGDLMTTLRDGDLPADLETPGGLADLDDLVARLTATGLRTEVENMTSAAPVRLSPPADAAAFAAIREGLTNAHKHGRDATARVRLDAADDDLRIVVTNPLPVEPVVSHSGGHGLLGIRERVEEVGGSVGTRRETDVFVLEVRLPRDTEKDT
ncbi:MAG: histidine kinase [Microbacterium arborescens]